MRDSKAIRSTIEAHRRGYRVDEYGCVISPKGKLRRCTIDDAGFYRFNIWEADRKRLHIYVHKLAAFQLYGEEGIRHESLIIGHRNTDRLDNRLGNIILTTRSAVQMGIDPVKRLAFGANAASKRRSLTDAQLTEFRGMRATGATLEVLCAKFGMAKSTASYIVNGRTYA